MPRKIKKKPEPKPSNEGKIILIVTGILLAVIAVFLIILAIVQNVGKKNEDTDKRETSTTVSQISQTASSTDTSTSSTVERPSEAYMDSVTLDMTKTYYADINVKGQVSVKTDRKPAKVILLRTGEPVTHIWRDGFLHFKLPRESRTDADDVVKITF